MAADDWKTDPRLDKWKQRCKIWQKSHATTTPMPITPEEHEELEDIFPAERRFVYLPVYGATVVAFGDPHYSQRFAVIYGPPQPNPPA